jgi:phosphoglycerate kinase
MLQTLNAFPAKGLVGKTVLLRSDLDAPHREGFIVDDYRIRSAVPTIKYLHENGAKVIILSKTGKPQADDHRETLLPHANRLGELLNLKTVVFRDTLPDYDVRHLIFYTGDIRDKKNRELLKNAPQKDIILLENVRFYPEEKNLDLQFAQDLSSIADFYVNDAFAMTHRNESSVTLLPKLLPAYAGLNLEKEIKTLDKFLNLKAKPFVLIIGGAKISDKVETIRELGRSADQIMLGGGPANLFFLAKGYEIGKSICEREALMEAQEFLRNFKGKIVLPLDLVVAKQNKDGNFVDIRVVMPDKVLKDEWILDIGPKTILAYAKYIKAAKKILWGGPMGLFEQKPFSHGTMTMALIFAAKSKGPAFGLAGGGDTLEALHAAKVFEQVDFVSTAGSAMLDFLAGKDLPGLKVLDKKG